MPSSYPARHMPLLRLKPGTSGKRWVSVANWATPVGYRMRHNRTYNLYIWYAKTYVK
ncbi:hypothetical protein Hanom_Chr07g00603351 [Helianthus anomalus]